MADYKNKLEQLIYKQCYFDILKPLSAWISTHPNSLELLYSKIKCPDSAALISMLPKFTTGVNIINDTVTFDAIVICEIELEEEIYNGTRNCFVKQWFRVNCSVTIEDKIKNFKVNSIVPYSKSSLPKRDGAADCNLVPVMYLKDLDSEATRFLEKYYPEALTAPMAVPIENIVKNAMGLNIIKCGRLTDDFSIFGQICFSEGNVKIYDIFNGEEKNIDVKRGTILIDLMTYWERNQGCVNNTIAHEAFHWHRHRVYAAVKSLLDGEKVIACRCPTESAKPYRSEEGKTLWTDEERMEWQANHVAPRILMPALTTEVKIKELYDKYDYLNNETDRDSILKCIIDDLAVFYKVSKQSAKIRMIDLGYKEAVTVYNFNNPEPYFTKISPRDAFYQYCDNEDFRAVIDEGLFRYIDERYIIDDEKYITSDVNGNPELTEYAQNNIDKCALKFTYRRIDMRLHGQFHNDRFHRTNTNAFLDLSHYDINQNTVIIDEAEELRRNREKFEQEFTDYNLSAQTFWQKTDALIKQKHWYPDTFKEKTNLSDMEYSRYKNERERPPSIQKVMAICIGLDINPQLAEELLEAAGYTLSPDREHQLYRFVLYNYRGRIDECNDFLIDRGLKPLGSQTIKS